jgi:hypothetical protein
MENSNSNFFTKLKEKSKTKRNRYVYIGQKTKHLQLRKPLFQLQKKSSLFKKFSTKAKNFRKPLPKNTLYGLDLKESQKKNEQKFLVLSRFHKQPLRKNPYLLLKSKNLQKKSQKRLF